MRFHLSEPKRVKGVFGEFEELKGKLLSLDIQKMEYDPNFGRYVCSAFNTDLVKECEASVLALARETFDSATLLPATTMFVRYQGERARLPRHKDNNACTYTLDCCVYQRHPWDLWVENRAYTLEENEALAYYGNDNEHWREAFPDPTDNCVAMLFFHFVEPAHWFFEKGPLYWRRCVEPLEDARARSTNPAHRHFLEFVLKAKTTSELYQSVKNEFPNEDPVEKVFGWVDELCALDGALQLPLNKSILRVARLAARGTSVDEICREMNAHRRVPATRAEIETLVQDLRGTSLAMLFP